MKDERPTASMDLTWTSQEGFIAAEPAPKGRRLRLPFLATHLLILLCLETTLFLALVGKTVGAGTFMWAHLGICAASAVLGWASLGLTRNRDLLGTVLLAATWTIVAGPFGPVMAAALLLPQRRRDLNPEANVGPALTFREKLHGSLLDRRLHLEQAHRVPALADVFIDGSQAEKFCALRLISRRYDPAMAPALSRALADHDGSVRVLAATVMAQQQNRFTKRIGALQSAAEARPETVRQWADLGSAHFDYARSNLLERPRVLSELRDALACLIRAAQLAPRDIEVQTLLAEIRGFAMHADTEPARKAAPVYVPAPNAN